MPDRGRSPLFPRNTRPILDTVDKAIDAAIKSPELRARRIRKAS